MHRHADMTMLPMYRIGKILPIYINNICSFKLLSGAMLLFCMECYETQVATSSLAD